MQTAAWIARTIDRAYRKPIDRLLSRQLFRYAVCGGITLGLDAVWYFVIYNFVVAHRFFDLGFTMLSPHIASMILVFPITFFNGFWLNRHVAFQRSPVPGGTQLVRYALSIAGSVLLTYAGLKFFVEVCHIWPTPSKIITTFITALYSFAAAKYFTFRGGEAR